MSDMLPYVPGFQRTPAVYTTTGRELRAIDNRKTVAEAAMQSDAQLRVQRINYQAGIGLTMMERITNLDKARRRMADNQDLNDMLSGIQTDVYNQYRHDLRGW